MEAEGRKVVALTADVRDLTGLQKAFDEGISSLGRVDVILANAGIVRLGDGGDPAVVWGDIIGTNLTGAWNTISVALPTLRAGGGGGCIIITSSTAGLRASPGSGIGQVAYTAAKTGLVGLMKQLAVTLAPESIRVNSVHPTGVKSGMTMNEAMMSLALQAAEGGGQFDLGHAECHAGRHPRARGHLGCGGVPRLGPSQVDHGCGVAGRRRVLRPLTSTALRGRPSMRTSSAAD